jgi:pyroglutamyl-peptidase
VRVLVTGFEPFGGDDINPSEETVRNLPRRVGGIRVSAVVLPVVYYASLAMLLRRVALERPDAVICLGLAGGRARLSFETRAVNLNDAGIPDNDGLQPQDEEICRGGPPALPPTLPLQAISRRLAQRGIPLELSSSAGTFLCNHVFYGLVEHIHAEDPSLMGGFVHVPFIPEQREAHPGVPTMDLESLVVGVRETIAVLNT